MENTLWPHNYFCMTLCHTHCGSATETGTLRCLQKEMATYRHWSASLWRNPDNVSHCRILSPDNTEWRLISATICGWRQRFVADQLWLRKRIREEEEEATKRVPVNSYLSINQKVHLDNSKGKRHQSTQYLVTGHYRPTSCMCVCYTQQTTTTPHYNITHQNHCKDYYFNSSLSQCPAHLFFGCVPHRHCSDIHTAPIQAHIYTTTTVVS